MKNQVRDYSPAITKSGLFWTMPIAAEAVQVDFDNGEATMRTHSLDVPDWGELISATTNGAHVPATVSFDVRWQGVLAKAEKRNEKERWMGTFIQNSPTIEWSARQDGFSFISNPRSTCISVAGVLGRERNGTFFS